VLLEQISNQDEPFILKPFSEESEEKIDIQLSDNEIETPTKNILEDSKEEKAEEILGFETQPELQYECRPEPAEEDAKQESGIQENLFEDQRELKPVKDEKSVKQKNDPLLPLAKQSVLQDFIAQKASQKDKPIQKTEKPRLKQKRKPKKQGVLKTSIPLSFLG